MDMTLDRLRPGERAVVTDMECRLADRLRQFGLVPGTEVSCRCKSPHGDVSAIEFRGSVVAMRDRDLRGIRVRC